MVVFGTRPEALKLFGVVEALRTLQVPTSTCNTGQHRDLVRQSLGQQHISPDIRLDTMMEEVSISQLVARLIDSLDVVFRTHHPTRIVVQGDTATALAGAQAAFFNGIPVAHVEAGLRTGRLDSPHPEEGNRRMITSIADLHFAPTANSAARLAEEGVPAHAIHTTGNTAIDAVRAAQARLMRKKKHFPAPDHAKFKRLIVMTCHRREAVPHLEEIASAVRAIAERPDVHIIIPLHPNPAVREPLARSLAGVDNIDLVEPLEYDCFVDLLSRAYLVLSDSGGIQEEAPSLGVPVLVLREVTERSEGIQAGNARLVGTSAKAIVDETLRILDSQQLRTSMARSQPIYGDGFASARIANIIAAAHGYDVAPLPLPPMSFT